MNTLSKRMFDLCCEPRDFTQMTRADKCIELMSLKLLCDATNAAMWHEHTCDIDVRLYLNNDMDTEYDFQFNIVGVDVKQGTMCVEHKNATHIEIDKFDEDGELHPTTIPIDTIKSIRIDRA